MTNTNNILSTRNVIILLSLFYQPYTRNVFSPTPDFFTIFDRIGSAVKICQPNIYRCLNIVTNDKCLFKYEYLLAMTKRTVLMNCKI